MKQVHLSEIISYLYENDCSFDITGELDKWITGFSSITNYKENNITWIKDEGIEYDHAKKISLCVAQKGVSVNADTVISARNSKEIFFRILERFFSEDTIKERIGRGTVIGEKVKIGDNVQIGNNCSIQGDIEIGEGTVIGDCVVIRNHVIIGKNCNIQSLTVIGEDGFAYSENDNHIKTMIKHYGGVVIGDCVFIGSHVNIARGTIDNTIIENGVKIAPTTHIGHNNVIASNATVICSQLFGSVRTGENAYITSSVVRNQCKVGKNTMVGMGSVVTKDIMDNKVVIGAPAKELLRKKI